MSDSSPATPTAGPSGSKKDGGGVLTSGFNEDDNVYLNLCPDPIRFEPVSKVTNVFYDEANQQVQIDMMVNCFLLFSLKKF